MQGNAELIDACFENPRALRVRHESEFDRNLLRYAARILDEIHLEGFCAIHLHPHDFLFPDRRHAVAQNTSTAARASARHSLLNVFTQDRRSKETLRLVESIALGLEASRLTHNVTLLN
jgi:hypothetical protein